MMIKFKPNPSAAKELAREVEKTVKKKLGKRVKVASTSIREIQRTIDKLGK